MNNIMIIAAGGVPKPDIYDDFSDGKYHARTGIDPWGRPLPEWTVESGTLDASNGYLRATSLGFGNHATLSTSTAITNGTWVFRYKWLNGAPNFVGNYYLISLLSQFLTPSGVSTGYDGLYRGLYLDNPPDGHWWGGSGYIIPRNYHFGYIIDMAGSQIDKSLVGGNNWHEVVFIKDADGYVYSWLDGVFVRWTSDKMEEDEIPNSTKFLFDFYDGSGTPLQYPMVIDDIKIYKDQYLPPNNAIIYNSSLNSIVINGFGANLSNIAAAVNNPSIFSYNPLTNTAIAYKDITIGRGSELRVENGKLLMSSSYDGERKINYYTDAIFKIYNSTIDSTNNYYYQWQRLSDGDSNLKNTFRVVNSTINNAGGIVLERPVAFYIQNSNFTNLVGSYPVDVYFRWPPRELNINNSIFSGKTGTEKFRLVGGSQFGQLSPKPVGIDIINSNYSNIGFECVQDSPYYLSPEYPGCVANIINTNLGTISYLGTTLRYKYYLDVKVVDSNGTPVSNTYVTAINENDDKNYPAENLLQGKKYFQLLNQLSPTGQQYFTGQPTNWFKGWADSNDHNTSITNVNGHTPLPSDVSNTLVVTSNESRDSGVSSYTYKVTASKNGYVNSLSSIAVDSTWYRSNDNDPTYTITLIIPDASPGLHLTGFAPSESNTFPIGSAKKFVVWTNQPLTTMNWYLDGAPVASNTMNYAWTATAGVHTIRFEGLNTNGSVSKQWSINGGLGVPSIGSFFPLDTSPTQNNGSTYNFSVTTTQTMNTDIWLLDGILMASGSQNYTNTWNHASIHTLTYSGSNGNGTVGMTWNVTVSDPDITPPASIRSIQNTTYSHSYINWNWIDPIDTDFKKVMIYLDGIFKTNITKGVQFYNATGLASNTNYTLSTHTVDVLGNVNLTWVNHTARTAPDPIPIVTFTNAYDNRLREGSPDAVLGGETYLDIGHITGIGRYRDVVWFNLSAFNSTDKITSAVFSLYWFYPQSSRNYSTVVELYRPITWNPTYVNWNNRTSGTPWTNSGGNWFDGNNAAYGSVPFASITFNASTIPDNRYYDFNVTDLVQSYVSGKYNNTGFFLKAKDEYDNYIAFYSSDWTNPDQRPKLTINYTTGGTPSNPAPSIASFFPGSLTPAYVVNSTTPFNVTTDQIVSSTWYLNGTNQNNNTQAWSHTWDTLGQYNVTYAGVNGNGSVSITWNISIMPDSPYDVNQDGIVNQTDLDIIWKSINTGIYCQRCDINRNNEVEVFDWVMVSGHTVK